MRCLSCDQPVYDLRRPCPHCHFQGDPIQVEELLHIGWLLEQMDGWQSLVKAERNLLRQSYLARQRELEIALGLRLPPFTPKEARRAWPQLIQRQVLLKQVAAWLTADLARPEATLPITDNTTRQMDELREQLEGHARPDYPQTDAEHLDVLSFLLEAVDYLSHKDGFVSNEAEKQARDPLETARQELEIKLGLRPAPAPVSPPTSLEAPVPQAAQPITVQKPARPVTPPVPFRDRLWRTLLSERTLQAMLFLGIFLLFAAAISFVVWGWRSFSAPLRVAIPAGFTLLFFALGWVVRVKTHLYRSGIALSAIAALLIPVDFYTVYANFNFSPEAWPRFWLITSLACLAAYVLAALSIKSRVFGYLVGAAAGSLVLAAIEVCHQLWNLALDWRTAGLSALAASLIVLATVLNRRGGVLLVLAEPFRNLALITVGVLMPLTLGWRYIGREGYDTLHYAMSVNWWLGGFIFGWGAIHYRSRSLGVLAALSLPAAAYMAQAALFFYAHINPAWHAMGWALLTVVYFVAGNRLQMRKDDPVLCSHGRTAAGWGVALVVVAALWSLTDLSSGAAAAVSHTVLCASIVAAAALWQRPRLLYAASLFSFSAATFAMTKLDLPLQQVTLAWASLGIAHIILALVLGRRFARFAEPVVRAGYVIAAASVLPTLLPYDGKLAAYALGNWLGLAAWGARLAHQRQPGFTSDWGRVFRSTREREPLPILHWLTALPLPVWLWIVFANRGPLNFSLPLALAALAWGMTALSFWLARMKSVYRWPWYLTGLLVSVAAPVSAWAIAPDGFAPAACLLSAGLLYFADALANRQSLELAPAGWVTAWGVGLFLDRLHVPLEALSLLVVLYFLAGLGVERKRSPAFTHRFLAPVYAAAHVLSLALLWRVYLRPVEYWLDHVPWTDTLRLWGAIVQLMLGVVYALYAWGTYRELWGHAATWLLAGGGAFLLVAYSRGRGSSAAESALAVIAFILAERGLNYLRSNHFFQVKPLSPPAFLASPIKAALRWALGAPRRSARDRLQASVRLTWRLYRRPLLATGWVASAGAIGLALVRNLILLGGGRVQQTWAVIGLTLITGLYAFSARLFRQARFAWLAALLVLAPWTILTNLGWFFFKTPTPPGFAVSWVALAWLLLLSSLVLERYAPRAYMLPCETAAHCLLPFSLLWGIAHADTSRITFALAIAFYALGAVRDYRRASTTFKFWYPALGLIPVWCVYMMAWLLPSARHEHYGLMLLAFGGLGLIAGQWIERIAPQRELQRQRALPGYLTGYVSAIVGTLLVAHDPALLALVLLYDTALLLISARLFRHPFWVYPASALAPLSLLLALGQAQIPTNRQGWWLIGLGAIYLALAWTLRRARLTAYGTAVLTVGFGLIALGLPPSSRDRIGAFWGYGSAALLYGLSAFWLRQPLLLIPASALAVVPYAVGLRLLNVRPEYHGLALLPGAVLALAGAWRLDARLGVWRDFPWGDARQWARALFDRLTGWWGLALYTLGFGLGLVSPFFTNFRAELTALDWLLLMPLLGWAVYRFRLRAWLLAMACAGHLAALYYLQYLGWWRYPAYAWVRFLPVTLITVAAAMWIEWRKREGSPLQLARMLAGWSRPLYALALVDVTAAQALSLSKTDAGALVTLAHALIVAVLASFWLAGWMPYLSAGLGAIALFEWLTTLRGPIESLPVALAYLALGYGLVGYALTFVRRDLKREVRPALAIWERPLQRFSVGFSFVIWLIAAGLGFDLVGWTVRAIFGVPFREIVRLETAQMWVGVLALLGLLYVGTAFTHRRLRLGYAAVGMLLAAWMIHTFYIQRWDGASQVQWYAIPAGIYLLGIAYLEWRRGNRNLARWLDYAAALLMMGSLFWQTLLFGWRYALALGMEGFAAFWWGSARRLRRFLYSGMMGVILAGVAQLINAWRSVNLWIVFGVIGLSVVIAAIVIERKMEDIAALRQELETWE